MLPDPHFALKTLKTMDLSTFNQCFFDFLESCPTPFHTTSFIASKLQEAGFTALTENEPWQINSSTGYYCCRDNGSIIAFKSSPESSLDSPWRMCGSHCDSPALQVKPNAVRKAVHAMDQLCVEVYGGPLLGTWFDRDLGIAGRVTLVDDTGQILFRTIDFKRPMAIIPSLAIHLDKTANKDHTIEKQKHLYPLLCQSHDNNLSVKELLLKQLGHQYSDLSNTKILGYDLFCYDTQKPALIGTNRDFIAAGRLDNLTSCYVGFKALLEDNLTDNCLLLCSNHEEIGSSSVAGAQGNFLRSILGRLLPDISLKSRIMNKSFFISMDNSHAVHPNFAEKYDSQHLPLLNHGPVIKYNSNQRYATTSRSAAPYQILCNEVDVPHQSFVMNNDMMCGATIGPIAATTLGVQTVDIGVPSLAMHSIRETTGSKDPYMLYQTICHYFTRSQLPQACN